LRQRLTFGASGADSGPSGVTVSSSIGLTSGSTWNVAKRIPSPGKCFHPAGTVH
jgi:hypothetical protein